MRILVTGANGQLGQAFKSYKNDFESYEFYFKSIADIDITDKKSLELFFENQQIDFVINCAAYTDVDGAENDKNNAFKVNAEAVENFAVLAKKHGFGLVHFSTDYVFDGESEMPYLETDEVNPINIYGASKLAGEQAILKESPENSIIIRTSWLYGNSGKNFVKTILQKSEELEELSVVNNQIGVLTNAEEMTKSILEILPKIKNKQPEIYHYSGDGISSWYDVAVEICDNAQRNCAIKPVSSNHYKTAAKRPKFSKLDNTKFKSDFGAEIMNWRERLELYLRNRN